MASLDFLAGELETLERDGRLRSLRVVEGGQRRIIRLDGREVVNFSSNDYLGLASHPAVADAVRRSVAGNAVGAGAARLISGTHDIHQALESELAELHGCESALLFGTGYMANIGVLSSLAGRGDVIFSDQLNHASIVDGARLSRAEVVVYQHADLGDLTAKLAAHPGRRRFIVTESVFSMDGDTAPLVELRRIADETDAVFMVDEAHAVGVVHAAGACARDGVTPDVLVATLGKSIGAFGAYVAGNRLLRDFLVNRARSFVFTTAPSLPNVAAARAGLALLRSGEGQGLIAQLQMRAEQLRALLREGGIDVGGDAAIVPLRVGDNREVMQRCHELLEVGLYVQGIRPPTVPAGTARLRMTLMATHTEDDVRRLASTVLRMHRSHP